MNLKIQGLVIASKPFGELHRLVYILTQDSGTISAVIFGGRRGRHAAVAPLFSIGLFSLTYNPAKELYSLDEENLSFIPFKINNSLELKYCASYICEALNIFKIQESETIFPMACSAIRALEEEKDRNIILICFIWKLICLSGMEANLSHCASCDRKLEENETLGFSSKLMTPVCKTCADINDFILPPGARRYLSYTKNMNFENSTEVVLSEESKQRIKKYLVTYLNRICPYKLKTSASLFL